MGSRKHSSRNNPIAAGSLIPQELRPTLLELIGEELPALEKALGHDPPISIRLNPAKHLEVTAGAVPWCSTGRYLGSRPAFTFDPLLHAGAYYVQEASSMFLEQALIATGLMERDVLALDLCAAPGGKSTHLRSLLTQGSLLVANEINDQRRSVLKENLWKWGAKNVVISGSDPKELERLPKTFDLIFVDAPCSGEGMFRKDPFARKQWNPALVQRCAAVQQEILPTAWHALAPGGFLIYSTCTWEPQENEIRIGALLELGAQCVDIPLDPTWGIERSTLHRTIGFRFYPHRLTGEGFFLSVVQKPEAFKVHENQEMVQDHEDVRNWLIKPNEHHLIEETDILYAVDPKWVKTTNQLRTTLRKVVPGIPIAERKGNEWRPHYALALNALLDPTAFPKVDLDLITALRYLRGEALSANEVSGVGLAVHRGQSLGWMQGAGNRWNNRWPNSWRIRMQQPNAPPVSWAT